MLLVLLCWIELNANIDMLTLVTPCSSNSFCHVCNFASKCWFILCICVCTKSFSYPSKDISLWIKSVHRPLDTAKPKVLLLAWKCDTSPPEKNLTSCCFWKESWLTAVSKEASVIVSVTLQLRNKLLIGSLGAFCMAQKLEQCCWGDKNLSQVILSWCFDWD